MGSYNFIGIPGASSGSSQQYNYLSSQIDIKENQLSSDGKLSPGDYDLLIKMARSAYSTAGLSPDQRSQIAVKISGYQKNKSTGVISDNSNISNLNDEVKNDLAKATMLRGNDPTGFLQAKSDLLSAKLGQLKDSIDTADTAGSDSSSLVNEFSATLSDYNDVSNALQDVKTYQASPTGQPSSDFAAYLTTNSKGEITDVQVGRQGSITGYSQIKALYGGLPIFGKVNSDLNNTKTFKLGNKIYTAPSIYMDETGAQTSPPLIDKTQQESLGNNFTKALRSAPYTDLDPNTTKPQGFIPDNGWAQGNTSSTFYQNNGGGKYTKYINADQKKLNIPDGGFIKIPKEMEDSIVPSVGTTTDLSAPMVIPSTPAAAPTTTSSTPPTPAAPSPTGAVSRTQAPVDRSPKGILQYGVEAAQKAGSFLGSLFGKGSSQ